MVLVVKMLYSSLKFPQIRLLLASSVMQPTECLWLGSLEDQVTMTAKMLVDLLVTETATTCFLEIQPRLFFCVSRMKTFLAATPTSTELKMKLKLFAEC